MLIIISFSITHEAPKMFHICCTARQCWPIGQFRTVLYNQADLSVLRLHLVIGQFSVFSVFHCSTFGRYIFTGTERNKANYRIGPNCAGRPGSTVV